MPFDADLVRARVPGRYIVSLESTASTMTDAARLAAEGHPPGTVVVADEQTAGQGRQGRRWHSEKGSGLYVSILMCGESPPEPLQGLTLTLGLAVREAILSATALACDLKWPNDLLLGGRKCAGILVTRTSQAVVAGVGVNVNQESFPAELAATATSLRMVSGVEHSREELLIQILAALEKRERSRHAVGAGCGQH